VNILWNSVILLTSFLFSIILTSLTIPFARKYGFIDNSSHGKNHSSSIPRIGGIGFILPFLFFILLGKFDLLPYTIPIFPEKIFGFIIISVLMIIILGLFDDRCGLSAIIKIPVQVMAAASIISSGLLFDFDFFTDQTTNLITNIVLTLFWILILINSINIIDGLDGLASKVVINILFFLIIIDMFVLGKNSCSIQLGVLISCLLGFQFFNRYPARTFMGDTGSTFLGAILAIYTLEMGLPGRVSSMLAIPIILFLFPFFDVFCTILRRTFIAFRNKEGKTTLNLVNDILTGDREHIHYRFLRIDGNHKRTVRIIVLTNFLLGLISILYFFSTTIVRDLLLFLLFMVMLHVLVKLDYLPRTNLTSLLLKLTGNNYGKDSIP
jgi:UDP-GlcNAc:undecaprenyl-phosphate/decaprenyl-phosphate GlcNAc-1-phosphate transferase